MLYSRQVERTRFEFNSVILKLYSRRISVGKAARLIGEIEELAMEEASYSDQRRLSALANYYRSLLPHEQINA